MAKIKVSETLICDVNIKSRFTAPNGNEYYLVTYSVDGIPLYTYASECLSCEPSPIILLDQEVSPRCVPPFGLPHTASVRQAILKSAESLA
jgi:hypothetical protein